MSGPFGSSQWMYEAGGGFYPYLIDNSLRFDGVSYLQRTPSTAGNQDKFTLSMWVKLNEVPNNTTLVEAGSGGLNRSSLGFTPSGQLQFLTVGLDGQNYAGPITTRVFRDVCSWYHLCLVYDSSLTTSVDIAKIYCNGVRITDVTQPYDALQQNDTTYINSIQVHRFNSLSYSVSGHTNCYVSEIHLLDGISVGETGGYLDEFGELKQGVWIPKAYSGIYGTNGFHLDFADGTSATTLGYDAAGSNDFTPSGIATTDQMLDSPTNNFATLNPLDKYAGDTYSEGNLKVVTSVSGRSPAKSTITMATAQESARKWYAEFYCQAGSIVMIGIAEATLSPNALSFGVGTHAYYSGNGNYYGDGHSTSYGSAYTVGDIIGVCFDEATGSLQFFKNGSDQGVAETGLSGDFVFHVGDATTGASGTLVANFGQDSSFAGYKSTGSENASDANGYGDFYYTPPTGYLALCAENLPAPTFDPAQGASPQDAFNVYTDTGANILSTAQSDYSDGLFWIKDYQNAADHQLLNTVTNTVLESNTTDAERAYSAPSGSSVAWAWNAPTVFSNNTDGSITSTVSANTDAGFSIVNCTAPTSGYFTVGHGLSQTPDVILAKDRETAGTNWHVWHSSIMTGVRDYMLLNATSAKITQPTMDVWGSAVPNSSVFGMTSGAIMVGGKSTIAYCFHSVEGYSKFGSYTGNGSADGPFVWCGFRPAFVIFKATNNASSWVIQDSVRNVGNPTEANLYSNLSNAEDTGDRLVDFLSNGFKPRLGTYDPNKSGFDYIFAAFAEQPFKYANAR